MHANAYYPLKVEVYKTKLDEQLLDLLWNKYWVATLSSSLLLSVSYPAYRKPKLTLTESAIRDKPDTRPRLEARYCWLGPEGFRFSDSQDFFYFGYDCWRCRGGRAGWTWTNKRQGQTQRRVCGRGGVGDWAQPGCQGRVRCLSPGLHSSG